MANNYNWVISALECYPEHESNVDVVYNIHWRRTADDGNGHTADVYSTQAVTYEAGSPFTPYANLTQEIVEGWLEAAMANQINPPYVTLAPPWAQAAE